MRHWRTWGRFTASAVTSAAIAYRAFVAHRPVPILDWFDLGVHEAAHLVAAPLPELVMFMAGSFAQIAFPLAMAFYFLRFRRDSAGGGFCLAWAGTSAWDVSVYIADAPVQALPLVGGGRHDWAYILGHFDAIGQADRVAGAVEAAGAALAFAGVLVALIAIVRRERRSETGSRRRRVGYSGLPVRMARVYEHDPDAGTGTGPAAMPHDPAPAAHGPADLPEDLSGDPWLADVPRRVGRDRR